GTGRPPLQLTRCEPGAFDRLIMAATQDGATVPREGDRGNLKIVARHQPTRAWAGLRTPPPGQLVKPSVPSDTAGERFAGGFNSERPQAPRLIDGPLERSGGDVPELPLALATGIGPREMSRIAPAVAGPITAAAGDRLTIRRKGERTNPIAV